MHDEHRIAGRLPCTGSGRNSCTMTQPLDGLEPMMPRFAHEFGSAIDGAAFAIAERLDVRRAAEQFERRASGEPWRNMFGRPEHAPDDFQPG
jgi:hypothetical protein